MVDGCASISVMMPLKEGWQKEDIILFSLHMPLYQISRISFCKGSWIYGALGNWFLNKSNLHLVLQYSTLSVVQHNVWITPQCHLDPMIEVHATYNFQLNSVTFSYFYLIVGMYTHSLLYNCQPPNSTSTRAFIGLWSGQPCSNSKCECLWMPVAPLCV